MDNVRFSRLVLWINGAVPAALLAWDAYQGHLGADGSNYALHTTGTMALLFLTLSLSITPLRKITGWNKVIFARRILGLYGFFYASAHFLIFWLVQQDGSLPATAAEIWKRWYLTLGFLALASLVPLAVTSTNGMIRRLGPTWWHRLHRLAYTAASLGVIHAMLQGKVTSTKSKAFAFVVGGLLAFRMIAWLLELLRGKRPAAAAAPAPKYWTGQLEVERVTSETPSVRTFRLRSADGGELPFAHLPGQYLNLALEINGRRVNRSYTIASAPTQRKFCELTIKREEGGAASCHLHETIKPGDRLNIGAPAGRFTFTGEQASAVVLLGGGVGITPLMSILRALTDRNWNGHIHLLYSVRTPDEIIFREELHALQKRFPNLHLHITVSRDTAPGLRSGRITPELLQEVIPDPAQQLYYVCGPSVMMDSVTAMLRTLGVPADRIKQEVFLSTPATTAAPSTSETPVDADVTFSKSKKTLPIPAGRTILEVGEEAGLALAFECRSGICGTCKTRMVCGRVAMEVPDALTPEDHANNLILLCQAKPLTAVTIEA